MADQQVTYELNLKDSLSPKVEEASHHVNHLEHSMETLGERVANVAEAFGISFAIFKGIEFVHEGIEEMEKLHKSEAALQNTMENMGTYTQEAFEKMVSGAHDLSQGINYTQADVMNLQSQLGLVGNIGEEEMGRITTASADLATKMGTSLDEAGNLLAKAINAPEMARRLGMALKIDPGVMEHIQNLAKHGHEAQARLELLAIAESKVGGAAEAAFNADPMARFNKTMIEVKEEVGALAIDAMRLLVPALEWIAKAFKDTVEWMKEHRELMTFIGYLLVGIIGTITAVSAVTKIWTTIQWALNAAMTANPISLIIVGIGALIAAVVYCYNHFAKFRAVLWATWAVIKEFASLVVDAFKSVYHVLHGIFTFNLSEIKDGFTAQINLVEDAAKRIAEAASKGYKDGMADFAKDQAAAGKESLIPKRMVGKPQAFATDTPKEPKTKATGSRSVTINVAIQKLGETTINVTNIKEGLTKLHDQIVNVLSGAVNDMQVVADH